MPTKTAPEETYTPACLCENLRQATRAVTRLYDQALRPAGMRITQFSVLTYLAQKGEQRGRDLGQALLIEETTLVRSLRLLEKAGWVKSHAGADKRERLSTITAEGKAALAKARPHWTAVQAKLRGKVSPAAWSGLLRELPKLKTEA